MDGISAVAVFGPVMVGVTHNDHGFPGCEHLPGPATREVELRDLGADRR